MKMIEKIQSMNIYEFTDFLNEYVECHSAPWTRWFDENYCKKCYAEIIQNANTSKLMEYSYCELNDKCRFFENMDFDDVLDDKRIIRMWLNSEVKDD